MGASFFLYRKSEETTRHNIHTMKLVYVSSGLLALASAQRPLPPQREAKLAITAALQDNFSTSEYNNLNAHGCWCSNFDLNNAVWAGGYEKVDDLDVTCAHWFSARMCTTVGSGSCTDGNDSAECEEERQRVDEHYIELIRLYIATGDFSPIAASSCPKMPENNGAGLSDDYCSKMIPPPPPP